MKTVLVTGSRDWTDYPRLAKALAEARPDVVMHGGARGADQMAGTWARSHGVQERIFPADWSTHGKRAGFLRNRAMVDTMPDECLAFVKNGSKGAVMTMDLAMAAGIPTYGYEDRT